MEVVSVIAAAIAAFAFGAVWYMTLSEKWMAATGQTKESQKEAGATPFIISFIALLVVAGMMRHIFALAGIDGLSKGAVAGFGLGLFIATPWVVTNYAYARRSRSLMILDGGYATIGCAVIGAVLAIL